MANQLELGEGEWTVGGGDRHEQARGQGQICTSKQITTNYEKFCLQEKNCEGQLPCGMDGQHETSGRRR